MPHINLKVRNGAVVETDISLTDIPTDFKHKLGKVLDQQKVHEIQDWYAMFNRAALGSMQSNAFAQWLQEMLPAPENTSTVETKWTQHPWKE